MKMKHLLKKTLLLLALMGGATSAWAQDLTLNASSAASSEWTGSYVSNKITLSFDGTGANTQYDGGGYALGNNPSGYTTNYFEVEATSAIEKVSFLIAGNSGTATSVQPVVWAWASSLEDTPTSFTLDAVSLKAGYNQASWQTYDVSSKDYKKLRIFRKANNVGNGKSIYIWGIKVWLKALKPTITTQPVSASYATGAVATALSVSAKASKGSLTYKWYSNTTETTAGATELTGETSSTYTPSTNSAGTTYYYCAVSDDNGTTNTNIVSVTVTDGSAPTKPSIEGAPVSNVDNGASVTLTASSTGSPAPTYQWYSNTTSTTTVDNEHKISGATSSTYSPSTSSAGTKYYYVVATNSEGSATSDAVSVTVNARTGCELTNIKFSNGAYGAINSATYGAGTIAVPYMAGSIAPTVVEPSIVTSDGATYELDGNTLTVTAEDGTTNKEFTITKEAVTPLSVSADKETTTFTDVPSWVFNLYGYSWNDDKEANKKGLKFAKAVNDGTMRIALGNTRQYYFVGAAKTLTLTGSPCATRKVNVYVNGTKVKSDVDNTSIEIALDQAAPCMVMVESNQTSGDGGFQSYAIAASTSIPKTIGSYGYATFSSVYPVDIANATPAGLKAYKATECDGEKVKMVEVTGTVAANTGLVLKGAAGTYNIPVFATGTTVTGNLLFGCDGSWNEVAAAKSGTNFVLTIQDEKVVWAPVKETSASLSAGQAALWADVTISEARGLRMVFGDDITGINEAKAEAAAEKDGKFVINGQLVIKKNGKMFNAAGAQMK